MTAKYKPLPNAHSWDGGDVENGAARTFTISFGAFAVATVSLPLFAFIFCVIYSLMFSFTLTTATHCNVLNLLPSLSAAIGTYSPQK